MTKPTDEELEKAKQDFTRVKVRDDTPRKIMPPILITNEEEKPKEQPKPKKSDADFLGVGD